MADDGEVLGWTRLANDPETLVAEVLKTGEAPEVAIEATYGWYWAVDALQAAGANVHLVAPSKLTAFEGRRGLSWPHLWRGRPLDCVHLTGCQTTPCPPRRGEEMTVTRHSGLTPCNAHLATATTDDTPQRTGHPSPPNPTRPSSGLTSGETPLTRKAPSEMTRERRTRRTFRLGWAIRTLEHGAIGVVQWAPSLLSM